LATGGDRSVWTERLRNGGRLAIEAGAPKGGSVAVAVFVGSGSRDERPGEWGAAHLLEHLAFKGAGGLDAEALADRMDRLGGDVNAFTTREVTCYHAHCLAADWEPALDLVWKLATRPHLHPDDLERERGVVKAELMEALDDPEDRAEQAYLRALYGRHPVTKDVLGSHQSLDRMDAGRVEAFHRRRYRAHHLTVVLAGGPDADPETVHAAIADRMAELPTEPPDPPSPRPEPVGGERLARVPGDQAYVVLGWPAVPWTHPDAMAHRLLSVVLGGQNTSRLWQRIRERAGLAYHVGASYSGHDDHGDLSFSAGVAADQVRRVLLEMADEWRHLRNHPPSLAEVDRARTQLKIGVAFQDEAPEGRMHRIARWAAAGLPVPTVDDLMGAIDRVGVDDLVRVARWLASSAVIRMALAVAGPSRALARGLREEFLDRAGVGA
jgi:predicted Zn-dependent peptidase